MRLWTSSYGADQSVFCPHLWCMTAARSQCPAGSIPINLLHAFSYYLDCTGSLACSPSRHLATSKQKAYGGSPTCTRARCRRAGRRRCPAAPAPPGTGPRPPAPGPRPGARCRPQSPRPPSAACRAAGSVAACAVQSRHQDAGRASHRAACSLQLFLGSLDLAAAACEGSPALRLLGGPAGAGRAGLGLGRLGLGRRAAGQARGREREEVLALRLCRFALGLLRLVQEAPRPPPLPACRCRLR